MSEILYRCSDVGQMWGKTQKLDSCLFDAMASLESDLSLSIGNNTRRIFNYVSKTDGFKRRQRPSWKSLLPCKLFGRKKKEMKHENQLGLCQLAKSLMPKSCFFWIS